MKNLFLILALFFGTVAFSQNLTIQNSTNCSFRVVPYSVNCATGQTCSNPICVPANSTVTFTNPCPGFTMDRAVIRPFADESCSEPCGAELEVRSENGCDPFDDFVEGSDCAQCSPFYASFSSPSVLTIHP